MELVVISFLVLALSAVLLGLRTAADEAKARRVRCMANLSGIMKALSLYTQDNQDFFPPNPDDGNTIPGYNWCPGQAGRGGEQEFDTNILANGSLCLVAPYLRSNASVFRCTKDPRKGIYRGPNPAFRGAVVPSARTISMNAAVGTVDPAFSSGGSGHSGKPTLSVNGPWLANTHSHRRNSPWRTYGRTAEIIAPTPANLFILLEEDPNSVNDASFSFGMNLAQWIDRPGALHENAGVLAFADGHAEAHRWVDPRTIVRQRRRVKFLPPSISLEPPVVGVMPVPNSADWLWLSQHTSAKTK
jgi:prepilin-type processing-associated H-X9-DG protein